MSCGGRARASGDEERTMSVERTFRCDGPECDRHVHTRRSDPPEGSGFLSVTGDGPELHFCGWDCLLRHSASKEPEQVIPVGD